MFFFYIDILIKAFMTIFRRFPTIFRRFPKILQNLCEGNTNVAEHFPEFSELLFEWTWRFSFGAFGSGLGLEFFFFFFFPAEYFWHLPTFRLLRLLWPLRWATLLWDIPESRRVVIHVLRAEWLVNLAHVDIGKFFVALERNSPILFFPIGLFRNQILSSWFRQWGIDRKNGLSGYLASSGLLYTNS